MATARVAPKIELLPNLFREIEQFETESADFKLNLRNHFLSYVSWLMAKLGIVQDKDSGCLSWIRPYERSPAEVLQEMLLDSERLYSELYLIRVAKKYSPASLSTRAHSIRLCYRLLFEKGLSPIDPARLLNPRSFRGNGIPLSEYWLGLQQFSPRVLNAERYRLAQFIRVVAEHWKLEAQLSFRRIRNERRALELLLLGGLDALDANRLNSITLVICRHTEEAVKVFFAELVHEPGANSDLVKDRVSVVRRFVAWLAAQGFTTFSAEHIVNPFGLSRPTSVSTLKASRKAKTAKAQKAKSEIRPLALPPKALPKLQKSAARAVQEKVASKFEIRRQAIIRPSDNLKAFCKLRNDLVTALLRLTPTEVTLDSIADVRIRHVDADKREISIPVPHAKAALVKLDATSVALLETYSLELFSGQFQSAAEAAGENGRLFSSLDGGTLLVNNCAPLPNIKDDLLQNFEAVRSLAMAAIIRTTALTFGQVVALSYGHVSDWTTVRIASPKGTLRFDIPSEARSELRRYGQFVRALDQFRIIWDSDHHNPLFLARDGERVTADDY